MLKAQVIGARESARALRRLPEFVRDDAQQAMDVTAFQFARMAGQVAPKSADASHGRPPGFLSRSFRWERRPRSLSAVVGVDPRAYYWKFLEYGTSKMGARPFVRAIAEAMRSEHATRLLAALERARTKMERSV